MAPRSSSARRAVAAMLALATATTVVVVTAATAPPASAAPLYGSLTPTVATTVISDLAPSATTFSHAGVERPLPAGVALRVTVGLAAAPGAAFVHQCGQSPDLTRADVVMEDDTAATNLIIPDDLTAPCITTNVDARLFVEQVGVLSASGPGFVPVDPPLQLLSQQNAPPGREQILDGSDARVPVMRLSVAKFDRSPVSSAVAAITPCANANGGVTDAWDAIATLVYGMAGPLCVSYSGSSPVDVKVELIGWLDPAVTAGTNRLPQLQFQDVAHRPPGFVPRSPQRILDTRAVGLHLERIGLSTGTSVDISSKVPAEATSVTFNLTTTGALEDGFATVYPCSAPIPETSSINYRVGQTVSNLVTIALASRREICVHQVGRAHLIIDLAGYYAYDTGSGYAPVAPHRLVDTRQTRRVEAGEILRFRPASVVAAPSADANAVSLTVTATDPAADGYLTAYPCSVEAPPNASTVNFARGETVSNAAIVQLGASGEVCLFAYAATDVVVDLAGYFDPSVMAGIVTFVPDRLADTRNYVGSPKLRGGTTAAISVAGTRPWLAATGVSAAVVNLTAAEADGDGYFTAYRCGDSVPRTSNVNYVSGAAAASAAIVALDSEGRFCLETWATSHYVVDIVGYVTAAPVIEHRPVVRH